MPADIRNKTYKMKEKPGQDIIKLKIHSWGALYVVQVTTYILQDTQHAQYL